MHLSDTELDDYLNGKLPAPRQSELDSHLSSCSECAELASRTRVFARNAADDTPASEELRFEISPAELSNVPRGLLNHSKYKLLRSLGEGGMGSVWLAEHTVMGRRVAIKVIRPEYLAKPGALERFRREARAVAQLQHANIVTAFDADEADGAHFLVMEYVPGENLGERLKKTGKFPIPEAILAARDVALGLGAAHAVGLIHRDIKPLNLIRTATGRTKILDFGLATAGVDGGELTGENVVMGTPDYIAPEQAVDARSAEARADLYSLGCTLYALLTGSVPFPIAGTLKKLDAHRNDKPKPIRELRPEVSPALAAVVERLMAKKPEDRFPTALATAEALEACRYAGGETEPPVHVPKFRYRTGIIVSAAVLLVIATVLTMSMRSPATSTTSASPPPAMPTKPATDTKPTVSEPNPSEIKPPPKPRETATLRELYAIENPGAVALAFSPKGDHWLLAIADASIRRQDTGEKFLALEVTQIAAVAWSADGALIALASDATEKVHILNAETGKEIHTFGPFAKAGFQMLRFGPDRNIAYLGHGGKLHRLDLLNKKSDVLYQGIRGTEIPFAALSPDGTRLVIPEHILPGPKRMIETQLRIIRIADGKDAGTIRVPNSMMNGIRSAAWVLDNMILCALESGPIRAYHWPDGNLLYEAEGHAGGCRLDVLEGGRIASTGADGFLRIWNAKTGEKLGETRAANGPLLSIAAAPDSPLVLSADQKGTVKAWRVETVLIEK